ncbi:uncharacterized protein TM35_000024130 [Trypanosoma theileri]|uniref:Uncharacterized protein n=1 Tax=Trypanosoma theileri TaxID=67003 RepID=A0A1X0P813_9TRYP|nr:uncharacterized protein TM35_000024130 [Trypanosoma theileri]ORC93087.1 hypothetical protein TM35_000024130 [Trypanosoma theileri]
MGPPRAKNGSNKSRAIISAVHHVKYFPCEEDLTLEDFCRTSLAGSMSENYTSQSSVLCIPLRKPSYHDVLEEALTDDHLIEIRRQKELLLMAYSTEVEEMVDMMQVSLIGNVSTRCFETSSSLSRRPSPWTIHGKHGTPTFHPLCSYIHDSPDRVLPSPCRSDLFYAFEKRQERNNSCTYSPGSNSLSITAVTPASVSNKCVIKIQTPLSPLRLLIWTEMEVRHALELQEERRREKCAGEEVAEYLRIRRAMRSEAHFHSSKFSSLAELHRKAREYFEEDVATREQREAAEHRAFMRRIPLERPLLLKLPSVTKTGRPYRCTAVDYEVARAVAMEEKVWNASYEEKKERRFFPQLL